MTELTKESFKLENVRSAEVRRGIAWSADVLVDGKKAFTVSQDGQGGPGRFTVHDNGKYQQALKFTETLPPVKMNGYEMPCDLEMFIAGLIDDTEDEDTLKTKCRDKAVVKLPGDDSDTYRVLPLPYSKELAGRVREYFPGAEIINERYL